MEKNGTPASPATARARRVFPVPGGPYRRMPFGTFAPIAWNLAGFSRYSLTSSSSSTASSTPATSAKVVFGWSLLTSLAFALPNDITRLPPPCIWFIRKKNSAPMRMIGRRMFSRAPRTTEPFWASVVRLTRRPGEVSSSLVRSSWYCAG